MINLKTDLRSLKLHKESFEAQYGDENYDPNMESTTCVAHDVDDLFEPDVVGEEAQRQKDIEIIEDTNLVVESIRASKLKLTPFEKVALQVSLAQIKSFNDSKSLSRESADADNFLTLVHEDLKEKATNLKNAAGDFIRKIWEVVVNFLRNMFGRNERLRKRGRGLLKRFESLPGEAGPDFEWEGFEYTGSIRRDGKTGTEEIYDIVELMSDIFEADTKDISEALSNVKDNDTDALKGVYGRFKDMCNFIVKDIETLKRQTKEDTKQIKYQDADGNEGIVVADFNISDRWSFGVREVNIDGAFFTTPVVSPNSMGRVENLIVPSMGKEFAKDICLKTLTLLDLNIKEDIRNSDKILRSAKLPKGNDDKFLTKAFKDLAEFVKNRNEMRYTTCSEIFSYLEVILKQATSTSSEEKETA